MTQATNTTLGEIKLAGDLAGNNNALAPELSNTAVTPGEYVIPKITVDSKGRITNAVTTPPSDIIALIPNATKVVKGAVIVGDNIEVATIQTNGSQTVNLGGTKVGGDATGFCNNGSVYTFNVSIDYGVAIQVSVAGSSAQTITDLITAINVDLVGATIGLNAGDLRVISSTAGPSSRVLISEDNLFKWLTGYVGIDPAIDGMGDSTIWVKDATTVDKGVVSIGSGLSVSGGVVSFNAASSIPNATTSSKGLMQVGTGLSVSGGVVSVTTPVPDATVGSKGIVQVGTNVNAASGVISIPAATSTTAGVVTIGTGLNVTNGVITMDTSTLATAGTPGVVKIGSGLNSTAGVISVNTIATAGNLGMVRVGTGLSIDGSGILSVPGTTAVATTSSKGVVQIGTNIDVSAGTISVATGTNAVKGLLQVGSGLSVTGGVVSVPDATTSSKGVMQVGSGLSVTAGVVSATPIPDATTSIKGLVQVGTNIDVASGVISVPIATNTTLGVVKPDGNWVTVDVNGAISFPTGSASSVGPVRVGDNINVTDGVISVPVCTVGAPGLISIASMKGLTLTNGVLDAAVASPTTFGMAQIGTNIVHDGTGRISIVDASTTVKGCVKVGTTGLSVVAGVVDGVLASGSTTFGMVKSGNTDNITITNGVIELITTNIPKKDIANTYTKTQVVAISTPSFAASQTLDFSLSNSFSFTCTSNFTLENPTNVVAGAIYNIIVKQDATGGRSITFGTNFKFVGFAPNIDTAPNATTIISCIATSTTSLLTQVFGGY